jgi:hypothetical protein
MSRSHRHERFPDDLEALAAMLREQRPTLDPLALDRIKMRAIGRARRATAPSPRAKGILMRSRLTTLLTIAFFALGTGGALALVGHVDFGLGGARGGSASFNQYRGGCGFGDKNHHHTGPPGRQPNAEKFCEEVKERKGH